VNVGVFVGVTEGVGVGDGVGVLEGVGVTLGGTDEGARVSALLPPQADKAMSDMSRIVILIDFFIHVPLTK